MTMESSQEENFVIRNFVKVSKFCNSQNFSEASQQNSVVAFF